MINHIVLFKFKDDATEKQLEKIYRNLLGLKNKIYRIEDISIGENTSPEKSKTHGYTHVLEVKFKDADCRDIYLWHPEHIWIVENDINPIKEDVEENVTVADYEV